MQALAVIQNIVVDLEVLQNLYNGKRRARQDGLDSITWGVQKADVLIHIADELRRQAFDVLIQTDCPLKRPVTHGIKDWVIDDDAIDIVVLIGVAKLIFQSFAIDFSQDEVHSTYQASATAPI